MRGWCNSKGWIDGDGNNYRCHHIAWPSAGSWQTPVVNACTPAGTLRPDFQDLDVRHDVFGGEPVPLRHIGLRMLDGIVTWALEDQPKVFTAEIPPDQTHITGELNFRVAAVVDPAYFPGDKHVKPHYVTEEQPNDAIIMTMDFNTKLFSIMTVVERPAARAPNGWKG